MARRSDKGAARRKRVEGAGRPGATLDAEARELFERAMRGEADAEPAAADAESSGAAKSEREKKAGDGFFSPFTGLKDDLAQLREQVARAEEEEQEQQREAREAAAAAEELAAGDLEAFQRAVADVALLPEAAVVGGERRKLRVRPARDDDAEVMAELADLVAGRSGFDSFFSAEHIEGLGEGIDRRLLRKLRKGAFSWGAHLDLHGLTRLEAKPKVEAFLVESRRRHHRCVLIVHGRGLHSRNGVPVLKEAVGSWLMRGRIARSVLAFCSARPTDGGSGAIYVLLRR